MGDVDGGGLSALQATITAGRLPERLRCTLVLSVAICRVKTGTFPAHTGRLKLAVGRALAGPDPTLEGRKQRHSDLLLGGPGAASGGVEADLLVLDQEGLVEGVDVDFGAGPVFLAGVACD
ncbi:hypothetical protein P4050_30570 [Pseudomonas aeruginosa]|nr:hypothetical protein [Pseudomonas aeruginosa]